MPPLPPPQVPFHQGVTFEANIGVGWAHVSGGPSTSIDSDADLAGADLGLGGWINPKLALSMRAAGVSVTYDGNDLRSAHYFIGPSAQFWLDDHIWFGGGAGLSTYFQFTGLPPFGNFTGRTSVRGLGLDLRAGYTFTSGTQNSFNVSVEANPGFYRVDDGNGGSVSMTGLAFLVGYQYL